MATSILPWFAYCCFYIYFSICSAPIPGIPTTNALDSPMRPGTEMSSRLLLNNDYKEDVGMFELRV